MREALGLLEVFGYTPAMAALDAMEKAAGIRLVQAELNDMLGVSLKVVGEVAAVRAAVDAGKSLAEKLQGRPVALVLPRVEASAWKAIESKPETSPLIQQPVVHFPTTSSSSEVRAVADAPSSALGFIETQGFTAVFSAIDAACKAAGVEVIGKEKLGGGYITIVVKGDVAAVKAAIDAGSAQVGALGKLIAAHVIARPSPQVLALLPKI